MGARGPGARGRREDGRAGGDRRSLGGSGENPLPGEPGEGPVESADLEEVGLGERRRAALAISLGALLGALLAELGRRARRSS